MEKKIKNRRLSNPLLEIPDYAKIFQNVSKLCKHSENIDKLCKINVAKIFRKLPKKLVQKMFLTNYVKLYTVHKIPGSD